MIPLTLLSLCSCSHVGQITRLADRQSSAIAKVDRTNKAIRGKTADYFAQIEYDLSQPNPEKTVPVALQLSHLGLALNGSPTDSEEVLESQVKTLLSNQKDNQNLISRLQLDGSTLLLSLQDTTKDRDLKTAQLGTASKIVAQDADTFSKLQWWFWGVVAFVIFMILLRLFFAFTATGAAIAAKIP